MTIVSPKPAISAYPIAFKLTTLDTTLGNFLTALGHTVVTAYDNKSDFDCLVFTGGADVSPLFYGERCLPTTKPSITRDREDQVAWRSKSVDFPKLGICRGAQLACVMSGGSLWQDVDKHHGNHLVECKETSELVEVTSTHHQMMYLGNSEHILLAGANLSRKFSWDGGAFDAEDSGYTDPEAAFFYNTNSLAIQWHPEYKAGKYKNGYDQPMHHFTSELIDQWIGKDIYRDRERKAKSKQNVVTA